MADRAREEVLEAIRSVVARLGKVPGRGAFETETGIGRHEWYGRYWARWGDALTEAGFAPNSKTVASDPEQVLAPYLAWVEELGRLPTDGEIRVRNRTDASFPGREAIRSTLGGKAGRVRGLLAYAEREGAHDATIAMLRREAELLPQESSEESAEVEEGLPAGPDGFVYLMKSGKHYKIGRTNALDRRQYEIGVQLPEKLEPVHSIRTDDPSGIEAYWHNRFRDQRLNGEWFRLTAVDVRTFKRRKFM